MADDEQVTLIHEMDWELRLVILGIGLFMVAYPFLSARFLDEAVIGLARIGWILGGAAFLLLGALGKSTILTAQNGEVTLREKGILGRSKKVLPASAVHSVDVGYLPRGPARHYVAVKIKGQRQLFMGDNHRLREDAEAERDRLLRALGRPHVA